MEERSWFDLSPVEQTAAATAQAREELATILYVLREDIRPQLDELRPVAEEAKLIRHLLSNPDDSFNRDIIRLLGHIKWILAALLALLLWRSF